MTATAEVRSFVAIGIACTAAYAALYALLHRAGMPATAANAVALTATIGVNFAANRRYTFDAQGGPLGRQLSGYAIAYALGLGASTLALAGLLAALGHPRGALDTAAAVVAGFAATAVRYALMRSWVFKPAAPSMLPAGGEPAFRPVADLAAMSSFPQVEVVVPVHNEQATIAASIEHLHAHLSNGFPFSWRIAIADNASTDGTLIAAQRIAARLGGVSVLHLPQKGRGRALRAAWEASDAEVVCYMDVDLSTDLRALLPLVAPLMSGHSDLAIGSRLAPGAHVIRGIRREVISRSYNALLRVALRARFSDAQCGFKAGRTEVVRQLLAGVRDEEWFFDTELLMLAQRRALRIHEVPVDWIEDTDSRVAILRTAIADLRGVARLMRAERQAAESPAAAQLAVVPAALEAMPPGPGSRS